MRRERLRFVVLAIVALLVLGLVLATTADPAEPAGSPPPLETDDRHRDRLASPGTGSILDD